jgi:hypothetical protein
MAISISLKRKAIHTDPVRLCLTLPFCAPNQPATATLQDNAIPARNPRHGSGSRKLKNMKGVKTDGFIELKDM